MKEGLAAYERWGGAPRGGVVVRERAREERGGEGWEGHGLDADYSRVLVDGALVGDEVVDCEELGVEGATARDASLRNGRGGSAGRAVAIKLIYYGTDAWGSEVAL